MAKTKKIKQIVIDLAPLVTALTHTDFALPAAAINLWSRAYTLIQPWIVCERRRYRGYGSKISTLPMTVLANPDSVIWMNRSHELAKRSGAIGVLSPEGYKEFRETINIALRGRASHLPTVTLEMVDAHYCALWDALKARQQGNRDWYVKKIAVIDSKIQACDEIIKRI